MKKYLIQYQDKDYEVMEPTIESWLRLEGLKDLLDEGQFIIRLISESTGLTPQEVMKADWYDISLVANNLTELLLKMDDKLEPTFEFNGIRYGFIDLPNLTFGEFIDIDTFLQKPEQERKANLHTLMAFLYREIDENDKICEYDSSLVENRAKLFKKLPVRYANGALSFFLRLEKILQKPSLRFLFKTTIIRMKKTMKNRKNKILANIGGGLGYLVPWRTKTSQK